MSREWKPGDVAVTQFVVIDPEDREAVERLRGSLERMSFSPWACGAATCLATALREFANPKPPKPEEPTGLGAVVEDAFGHTFIPGMSPAEFVQRFFLDAQGMTPMDEVTRIEWRYLDDEPHTPREQAIEAAEDRAEQAAFDAWRERSL